jgi:hypothetical protein
MGVSIYKLFQVTYNDYISDYDRYLSEFLNEYEDNTELYFIKEQKSILDSHLTKFKDVVINLVDEDENKEEILDLFRNRINTTDRIKAFLEQRKQQLEKESVFTIKSNSPQRHETIKDDRTSQLHPKYDPNLWNNDCFELFKYLYDCYYKNRNRQLTNIWFFLKNHTGSAYVLKATKDEYAAFIFEKYQKKLSNFDKALDKWNEKELPTLQDHRIEFEGALK